MWTIDVRLLLARWCQTVAAKLADDADTTGQLADFIYFQQHPADAERLFDARCLV
ncbi:MAG TPA: hypothetical protein VJM34_02920 [Novosphingobium sp.]|nr:hypothetical protein [Novosphingobium sp.]